MFRVRTQSLSSDTRKTKRADSKTGMLNRSLLTDLGQTKHIRTDAAGIS